MSCKILVGDSREMLAKLPSESVQLCVTSPPYDQLRSYNGALSWDFEGTARELYRVLCPGGVVCWNVGDSVVDGSETLTSAKQKIFFRETVGFRIHDTMIYEKLNFSVPDTTRYHQAFEYLFILSRGRPRVFNPLKDRQNAYGGQMAWGNNTKRKPNGSLATMTRKRYAELGMRTNVWRGKTRGQEEPCQGQPHPAMMPKWLARDLIISWSNVGDTVVDPFCGSGTVGAAAVELGRHAVLIDINPEYADLARRETNVTPGLALA